MPEIREGSFFGSPQPTTLVCSSLPSRVLNAYRYSPPYPTGKSMNHRCVLARTFCARFQRFGPERKTFLPHHVRGHLRLRRSQALKDPRCAPEFPPMAQSPSLCDNLSFVRQKEKRSQFAAQSVRRRFKALSLPRKSLV
jgi:hypothetical protein